ncbi:MAG TPA: hypothetical protein VF773_13260 [Verrucomicrobiae bacterium]
MKKTIKDGVGILIAVAVFAVTGILLIPVVAMFWPIDPARDIKGLKPQHFPTIAAGFLLALYTFRRFTKVPQSPSSSQVST